MGVDIVDVAGQRDIAHSRSFLHLLRLIHPRVSFLYSIEVPEDEAMSDEGVARARNN